MTPAILTASGVATDIGQRRSLNEDAALASAPCFLVADGMGGHDSGDVAAATAVSAFQRFAGRASLTVDEVRDAIDEVRACLEEFSEGHAGGAGTTLSGVAVADVRGEGYWMVLNVGDSRTYRLQDGSLTQLTVDHSLVQEMIEQGVLTPEAARRDQRRNVVTRALGASSNGVADTWMLPAHRGDRILVCSDGLSDELTHERIEQILLTERDPQVAATLLVHEAHHTGGRDNITAIVVDAVDVTHAAPTGDDDVEIATLDRGADGSVDTRPRSAVTGSGS
ncbi:PP2C family serine/threonine-protein phosphatase [Microbacterium sp. G2-8]|uniref:PP2C family protein-serine/threonine phosphatase n=1 Tax=Microbacterium sp. G2-8 TaxID=2842454 RepID=UPI001C89295D|nr:protein phosphatase 2C domain-containing protein [Microbacterium sp. G2-8]